MLFRFAKRFFKKNDDAGCEAVEKAPILGDEHERRIMTNGKKERHFGIDPRTREIVLGKWRIGLPDSPVLRILVGTLLIVGGVLGFLPVLGFWMIPLGLLVLSHDIPAIRRRRRKLAVWWARWRGTQNSGKS
ncbi:hypothetical protein ILFOPFJJ_04761 [Ensifer psoraleae]|nr:hypothetical protein [Sinorhizobium psoraleae]